MPVKKITLSSYLSDHCSDIPNVQTLIPTCTGTPPFTAKQTPINTHDELGMLAHPAQFRSHDRANGAGAHDVIIPDGTGVRTIAPYTTGHIIAGAEEHVGEMGRPDNFANGVIMSKHGSHGSLLRCADIEGADGAVDSRRS